MQQGTGKYPSAYCKIELYQGETFVVQSKPYNYSPYAPNNVEDPLVPLTNLRDISILIFSFKHSLFNCKLSQKLWKFEFNFDYTVIYAKCVDLNAVSPPDI